MTRYLLALLLFPASALAQPAGSITGDWLYGDGVLRDWYYPGDEIAYEAAAAIDNQRLIPTYFRLRVYIYRQQWSNVFSNDTHQTQVSAELPDSLLAMTTPLPAAAEQLNYYPYASLEWFNDDSEVMAWTRLHEAYEKTFWQAGCDEVGEPAQQRKTNPTPPQKASDTLPPQYLSLLRDRRTATGVGLSPEQTKALHEATQAHWAKVGDELEGLAKLPAGERRGAYERVRAADFRDQREIARRILTAEQFKRLERVAENGKTK